MSTASWSGFSRTVADTRGMLAMPATLRAVVGAVALLATVAVLAYWPGVASAQSSTDATLSALTVDSQDVAGFSASRTSYQFGVAAAVTTVTVEATENDAGADAVITPGDTDTTTPGHQVSLSAGRNAVTVTVTAADTTTTKAYTVSVNRGVTAEYGWKASEDLDGLIAASNQGPRGIWSDGATMWVVDEDDNKIYAYGLLDGNRDEDKDFDTLGGAGNESPVGLWSDGVTMWVADGDDEKIYAYKMSDQSQDTTKEFGSLNSLNRNPWGIWSDGVTMWVSDFVRDRIFAYRMSNKSRDTSKEFSSLNSLNGRPQGIWSDETTMWVSDPDADRVFAYRMSNKRRDTSKEFSTLGAAGNNAGVAVWSDGATMWVSDSGDDKLYSYNHPIRVESASVDGTSVTIVYNQALGAAAGLTNSAFSVKRTPEGGSEETLALTGSPVINGKTVTLTLTVSALFSDTLFKVTYAKPTSGSNNKVIDVDGNEAAGFSDLAATNDSAPSTDATLSALTVSPAVIADFAPDRLTYEVDVDSSVDTVTVTATTNHPGATVRVIRPTDADAVTDGHQVSLSEGRNQIDVVVAAEDNVQLRRYTVNVDRAFRDSELSALTVSPNDITGFASDRTSYEVDVAASVTAVTVAATANHSTARVSITPADADTVTAGHQISLSEGRNRLTVTVDFADNPQNRTVYTVHVDRESRNSTLSALTVSPDDITGFAPRRTSYEVEVANSVTAVTVTATANHSTARVSITPADADTVTAGHQISLSEGRNRLTVTVDFADNPQNRTVYTVHVNRVGVSEYTWRVSDDFNTLDGAGNNSPRGIWSDGTTMWVVDADDDKIYAYKMSDRSRDRAKDFNTLRGAGNNLPHGIWSDGTTMWVVDSGDDKIYAYRMSNRSRDRSKDFNTLAGAGNRWPTGIWSDGTTMWVTDTGDDKIYAYRMSNRSRDRAKDFNTLAGAGNRGPGGIWSDGAAMWVTDLWTGKLFAYRMSDRSRDGAKEFNTLIGAGNRYSGGIWSDGATMWVAQFIGYEKIFSYNHPAVVVSAEANGTSLVITFSQDLAAATGLSNDAFTVRRRPARGPRETASLTGAPVISGKTVTLTLTAASAMIASDTGIEVTYTKPTSGTNNKLTGSNPGGAAGFTFRGVTNSSVNALPAFSGPTLARSVAENTAPGENIGAPVAATDADVRDVLTYTLSGTDAESFDIAAGSGQIRTRAGVAFDYEAKSSYTVTVTATDTSNATAAATVNISVTDRSEPPAAPETPKVAGLPGSTTGVSVTWTAPDNDGKPPITGYDVRYREGDSGDWTDGPQDQPGPTAAVRGLTAATAHQAQVRATNHEGDSDWSPAGSAATHTSGTTAPGRTTGLVADATGPTQIDLSWTAPSSDGGAPIAGYRIETSTDGAVWTDVVTTDSTDTAYSHTGLPPYRARHYRVSAINTFGLTGAASATATETTNVVVRNTGQDQRSSHDTDGDVVQYFRTGSNRSGYFLTGVDVVSEDSRGRSFTASIWTTTPRYGLRPQDKFADLTAPSSFAAGTLTFTAPANTRLSANTVYALWLAATDIPTNTSPVRRTVRYGTTTANGEDSGAAAGWDIGDRHQHRPHWLGPSGFVYYPPGWVYRMDWDSAGRSVRMALRARRVPDTLLSALTVSPSDIAGFTPGRTSYEVGVDHTVTTATVAATRRNSDAAVTYSPADADPVTDGHQVSLSTGRNPVTVTVTAVLDNATTTTVYTLSINRGVAADYGWKASDDLDGQLAQAKNQHPTGVWSNGTTMWVADHATGERNPSDRKIDAYQMSDRSPDSAGDFNTLAPAGNFHPTAIWSDGTTMWVTDDRTRRRADLSGVYRGREIVSLGPDNIYAYRMSDKSRDPARDLNFTMLRRAGIQSPTGIWSDGTTMWVANDMFTLRGVPLLVDGIEDVADDKIYAFRMSDRSRDPAKDFDTLRAAGNESPRGIWSDGATMWVADAIDDKIYAYRMSDRSRDPARDFNTLSAAGNGSPRGIWSDGATMWVADIVAGKVYSYNHPLSASAEVDETSLVLTFNRELAADSLAGSAFTVNKTPEGGARETVAVTGSPVISGRTVTLTLAEPAVYTDTVEVSYTRPVSGSGNRLADTNGRQASSFVDEPAVNNSPTPPGKPTGLTAAAEGKTQIDLSWSAPRDDGGAAVTGYRIEVSIDGHTWVDLVADTGNTGTTYSHTGLIANSLRHYRVSAINSAGTGPASDISMDTTTRGRSALRGEVFVANTGQGDDTSKDSAGDLSQRFTTGGHSPGYTLTSIVVGSEDSEGDAFTAEVWTVDTGGHPADRHASLKSPARFEAGMLMFTAPAGTKLTADTDYAVVLSAVGKKDKNPVAYDMTTSDSEDPGAASGWRIEDTHQHRSDGVWSDDGSGRSFRIAVSGLPRNAPVFSPSAVSRSVAENTAAGHDVGAAVTATDADADDTLTYTLSGTDAAKFDIVAGSGQLRTRAALDREAKSSYTVTVTATDPSDATATATVTITVTDVDEPPAAPEAPTVNAVTGTTSLSVSWAPPDNAGKPGITGYDVRYWTGSDGDWADGPQDRTGVAATIAGLTGGATYQVQVRAVNDEGRSAWSLSGSATTHVTGNSAPVFSPSAVSRSVVENTAAGQDVGAAVTATDARDTLIYTLSGADAAAFDIVAGSGQIRTRAALDREAKSSYTVTVTATDTSDATAAATVTITVTDIAPPAAPAQPTVTATGSASLLVSWPAPSDPVDSYDIRYLASRRTVWVHDPSDVIGTSATITGLDASTEYIVQVRATDSEGDSDWSDIRRGTTRAGGAPSAPVFSRHAVSRSVAENTAAGQDVGAAVTATDADADDTLTYTLSGTDAAAFDIVAGSGQIRTRAALDHETGSSYTVTVTATDGTESAAATVTVTVSDVDEPPAVPPAPAVGAVTGTTSLSVSWMPPDNSGKPDITGYDVRYRAGNSGDWIDGPQDQTGATATIVGLTGGATYQVQVRAANDEGRSAWSSSGSATTDATGNTAPVFSPSTVSRSVAENTAAGQDVGAAVAATDADGDTLVYTLSGADAASFDIVAGSGQIRTRAALDHETKSSYTVTVTATDTGNATATATVTVTVTDVDEPPAAPDTPTVSAVTGTTSLTVSWTPPDNEGKSDIDSYYVRYRKRNSRDWIDGPRVRSGDSVTITGLDSDATYEVQVRAGNDEGDSAWSSSGSASTIAGLNSPATGAPTVGGTARVGDTLTASTAGVADPDGLTDAGFAYQWVRNDGTGDSDISGATARDYTLVSDDEGKTIKVRVSFADDAGFAESLTSAATVEVAPEPYRGVEGTMTVGTMDFGGAAVRGYATRGAGMGAFVVTASQNPAHVGGIGGVRLVMHAPGEVTLPEVGEVTDSLTFGYLGNLATPFTLLYGSTQLSSAHAVNPGGDTAPIGRFWVWEDITPGWEVGDEVTVRATGADELLAGTEPVWHSKLTVGVYGSPTGGYLGYQDRGDPSTEVGALDPGTATVDGDAYEFFILAQYLGFRRSSDGTTHTEALDFYAWDKEIPSEWVLTVNGDSFRVGDTNGGFLIGLESWDRLQYKVSWKHPGLEFEQGATYAVTLSRPATEQPEDDQPEDDQPEDDQPEDQQPEDQQPEDQQPEDQQPEDQQPEDQQPEDQQPEDQQPEDQQPEDQQPEDQSEDDQSEDQQPEDEQPEDDQSEDEQVDAPPQRTPLTAQFAYGVIHPHRGDGSQIIFRVRFSEEVPLSYRILRDSAFTVTGGRVARAQRVHPPANQWWTITVQATGDDPMEVVLPATTDCATTGAICADDGTMLSNRNSVIFPGPSTQTNNSESLTRAATATVPPALTASSHDVATSHDGRASFTFELRFSEETPIGYVTLRDDAFTVTGGEVVNARRLERPANLTWEITVRPHGSGDVTVVLPATADCSATGAVCTADGRKLSTALEIAVTGPGGQ